MRAPEGISFLGIGFTGVGYLCLGNCVKGKFDGQVAQDMGRADEAECGKWRAVQVSSNLAL